jgi:release factor glutamine methyltransferase
MSIDAWQQLQVSARQKLRAAGIDNDMLEVQLLAAHLLNSSREELILNPPVLDAAQQKQFEALVLRRANREPMSHILGVREFYGRNFKVTKDVLDPRPDTETLIEVALKYAQPKTTHHSPLTILDIGTGSGCILLTLLAELPEVRGMAVDISESALTVAQENAVTLGLSARAEWVRMDMREIDKLLPHMKKFDLIISNPPYIPTNEIAALMPEVTEFEPKSALDGGKDGLDYYRILARTCLTLLKPNGLIVLETGDTQAAQVVQLFETTGYTLQTIAKDLAGHERCVAFKL